MLTALSLGLCLRESGQLSTTIPLNHGITITYIYMCVCTKKIVIERTRDLIYLKFVVTDFFPKIISPSAGENSGDLA